MSRRNRKWVGLVALAAILIVAGLVIAACGSSGSSSSSSPSSGGTPKAGGTYNFPLGSEPISIEPLNTQESEGANVEHQIFQGLEILKLQPDGTTQAVPDLADGPPQVNSNATVFTFKIKQGVMFGPPVNREVTAQDFVDSWNYVANAKNQSATVYILAPILGIDANTGYAGKNGLTGVKALDKYTLQITLTYPFADFPATLVHPITQAFPVDYVNKIGRKAFFDKPVGTGPYMVQDWTHNQSITLVKNPSYWNTSGSGDSATPGNVDTINMPIYTDNSTEWLAFQKGTLDYSSVPSGNVHAAENNANVKSGAWTAKAYASTAVYFISVSMNKPMLGGSANLPIRAALNYAADRTAVCNIVNEGVSIPSDEIVPVTIPGYKPASTRTPTTPPRRSLNWTSSPVRCRPTSRTGTTPVWATTRSPRCSLQGGPRPCPSCPSSSTASRPTPTGLSSARTRLRQCSAWAGSPTTRRSTTSSISSPPRAASTAATRGTATRRSTSSSSRRAARSTRRSASISTTRPSRSSSRMRRVCRCTRTATSASPTTRSAGSPTTRSV